MESLISLFTNFDEKLEFRLSHKSCEVLSIYVGSSCRDWV